MDQLDALIHLLHSKYAEIRDIETRYHIFGHEGDYRPRIEYYHDAVRALGSEHDDGLSKDSRLSVERLAYDIEMLRLITARPLTMGRGEQHFSVSQEVSVPGDGGDEWRPDRKTKQHLSKQYKDYSVYFAAIMAEKAENNVQVRSEEADILLEDCQMLDNLLAQLAAGELDVGAVLKQANMMEHDGLRRQVMAMLQQGAPDRQRTNAARQAVHGARGQLLNERQQLDKDGMRVASGQLGIYESSKDVVQELAANGLNIAGRFTEKAMQQGVGMGKGSRGI